MTVCLSPACKDRSSCARHWSHYPHGHNPYQSYACFDGSRGKECEHYVEKINEHRAAPSQPGIPETET